MEIGQKAVTELMVYLLGTFRDMEHELLAHQIVFLGIRRSWGNGEELDLLLSTARQSPELLEYLGQKYDDVIAKAQSLASEYDHEEALEFLMKCKPAVF
jgi:hypothetical protein